MQIKRVPVPERVRAAPRLFAWIDRPLVRRGYIECCDAQARALGLLRVTVADYVQELSCYGSARLPRPLSMGTERLVDTRADLIGRTHRVPGADLSTAYARHAPGAANGRSQTGMRRTRSLAVPVARPRSPRSIEHHTR